MGSRDPRAPRGVIEPYITSNQLPPLNDMDLPGFPAPPERRQDPQPPTTNPMYSQPGTTGGLAYQPTSSNQQSAALQAGTASQQNMMPVPVPRSSTWPISHDLFLFESVHHHRVWTCEQQAAALNQQFGTSVSPQKVKAQYEGEYKKGIRLEHLQHLALTEIRPAGEVSDWPLAQECSLHQEAGTDKSWPEMTMEFNRFYGTNWSLESMKRHYQAKIEGVSLRLLQERRASNFPRLNQHQHATSRYTNYESDWPLEQDVFLFEIQQSDTCWIQRATKFNEYFGTNVHPRSMSAHWEDLDLNRIGYEDLQRQRSMQGSQNTGVPNYDSQSYEEKKTR